MRKMFFAMIFSCCFFSITAMAEQYHDSMCYEYFDTQEMPQIADLKDIKIYGVKSSGVVVCIGNKSESASVEQLVNDDGFMMTTCVKENQKRQEFFNDIKNMKFGVLARKYTTKSASKNLKDILKTVLIKTGIFDKIMYRRMIK